MLVSGAFNSGFIESTCIALPSGTGGVRDNDGAFSGGGDKMWRRKLKLKAKFERCSSYSSFKR